MGEADPEAPLLTEVGRYPSAALARDAALVLAAQGLPYWIDRENDSWALRVETAARSIAVRELTSFAKEQQEWVPLPTPAVSPPIRTASLYFAGWMLSSFFLAQQLLGKSWTESGTAASVAITRSGEWWRTVTALTLHADLSHLVANVAAGLLFAAFLIPQFGSGMTWLLILLAGAFGNGLNAFSYQSEEHLSIGASTAVFGALGLLVGADLAARWSSPATRNRWGLVLPLGAGLALLAYLGAGDVHGRVDILAHGWGFAIGLILGCFAPLFELKQCASRRFQQMAGSLAIALLVISWALARSANP